MSFFMFSASNVTGEVITTDSKVTTLIKNLTGCSTDLAIN
jgi:hypothetical protein